MRVHEATMSTTQAARALFVDPSAVRRMITDGRLSARRCGNLWRVDTLAVRALAARLPAA